ncbi:hypothetical protein E2562_000312, partial [Oryza meyeriana var. granulata]
SRSRSSCCQTVQLQHAAPQKPRGIRSLLGPCFSCSKSPIIHRSSRSTAAAAAAALYRLPGSCLHPQTPVAPRHQERKMPEAEWNDDNTRIICELYAEQVRLGNRPSTHLNSTGYSQVLLKFQQRTQLLYTKRQLKNKWDKLRNEYAIWKKLLIKGSGLGWNSTRGTIAADENWWKKTNT